MSSIVTVNYFRSILSFHSLPVYYGQTRSQVHLTVIKRTNLNDSPGPELRSFTSILNYICKFISVEFSRTVNGFQGVSLNSILGMFKPHSCTGISLNCTEIH